MTETLANTESPIDAAILERQQLAEQLATEAAISDIELYCAEVHIGDARWFDTSDVSDGFDRAFIDRAVRFLDISGRLQRKAERPLLVHFLEPAE